MAKKKQDRDTVSKTLLKTSYKKSKMTAIWKVVLSRRIKGSFERLKVFVSDRSTIPTSTEILF